MMPVTNGYELARLILEQRHPHGLEAMLELHRTQESDWLELKGSVLPARSEADSVVVETHDDYYWNVVHAIVAMTNSCGGVIFLGIGEKAGSPPYKVIGLEASLPPKGADANAALDIQKFLQAFRHKLLDTKKWTLGRGKCFMLHSLLTDQHFEFADPVVLDGKTILPILVKPSSAQTLLSVEESAGRQQKNVLFYREANHPDTKRIEVVGSAYNEYILNRDKQLLKIEPRFNGLWGEWHKLVERPRFTSGHLNNYLNSLEERINREYGNSDIRKIFVEINAEAILDSDDAAKKCVPRTVTDIVTSEPRIWLSGPPGSGKTFVLDIIALRLIDKLRADHPVNVGVPVVVRLNLCGEHATLTSKILAEIKNIGLAWSNEVQDRIVLLLDGFNEVDDKTQNDIIAEIDNITRNSKGIRVIMSSRPDSIRKSLGFAQYRVMPLDKSQIEAVIQRMPRQNEQFRDWLMNDAPDRVRSWGTTPLYLDLLSKAYRAAGASTAKNMSEIIRLVIDQVCKKQSDYINTRVSDILAYLAFHTRMDIRVSFPRVLGQKYICQVSDERHFQGVDPDAFLECMVDLQLLKCSNDIYTFAHELFQEYFAALHLCSNEYLENGSFLHFCRTKAAMEINGYWGHVVILAIGLYDREQTDALVSGLIDVSVYAAAKAYVWISYNKPELREKITGAAKKYIHRPESLLALAALGEYSELRECLKCIPACDESVAEAIREIFHSTDLHDSLPLLRVIAELGVAKRALFVAALQSVRMPEKTLDENIKKQVNTLLNMLADAEDRDSDYLRVCNMFHDHPGLSIELLEKVIVRQLGKAGYHDFRVIIDCFACYPEVVMRCGIDVVEAVVALKHAKCDELLRRMSDLGVPVASSLEEKAALIASGQVNSGLIIDKWLNQLRCMPELFGQALQGAIIKCSSLSMMETICKIIIRVNAYEPVASHEYLQLFMPFLTSEAVLNVSNTVKEVLKGGGWPTHQRILAVFESGDQKEISGILSRADEYKIRLEGVALKKLIMRHASLMSERDRRILGVSLEGVIWDMSITSISTTGLIFAKCDDFKEPIFMGKEWPGSGKPAVGAVVQSEIIVKMDSKKNRYGFAATRSRTPTPPPVTNPTLVAVIDLGTKATRLIIGDIQTLQMTNAFSFDDYKNCGQITNAGRGLYTEEDGQVNFRMSALQHTINVLRDFKMTCREKGVLLKNIIAVGTEVFRKPTNRHELAKAIRSIIPSFLVLDPSEEARTTFWAAMVSCKRYYEFGEPFILIEQGGGSTQITIAEMTSAHVPEVILQESIPDLGTVLLHKKFMENERDSRMIGSIKNEAYDYAKQKLHDAFGRYNAKNFRNPRKAIGVGTVITNFYVGKNKDVHGKTVYRDQFDQVIPFLEPFMRGRWTVAETINNIRKGLTPTADATMENFEKKIEMLYGLQCYAATIDYFKIPEVRICGAGLRYGVLFRVAYKDWTNINDFAEEMK